MWHSKERARNNAVHLLKQSGLSLLEVFVAISLFFISIFAGIASYTHFVNTHQLAKTVNTLLSALRYARSAAVEKRTSIRICPKNAQNHCGTRWGRGQLVMSVKNQQILRIFHKERHQYRVFWRSSLGFDDFIEWQANGMTHGQQGSFFICPIKGVDWKSAKIVILRTGRLRSMIGHFSECG